MISKCKKLVTDITRQANLDTNLGVYADTLSKQYNFYATVKMCMNYYTMKEVISDFDGDNQDVEQHFCSISKLIERHIKDRDEVVEESIAKISSIRDDIEAKMKVLTAFTDGYELYEYVLNRVEAGIKNTTKEVDVEQLSVKMFQYVFSEKDTVVINSKLQLLMSQLPVRMTKNKFYDIVTNTLTIYKGGETSSVDEFVDMLKTTVLITKPEGFETEYPNLYQVYKELSDTDYKTITEEQFDALTAKLNDAAAFISESVSAYMLLQEIVNDVYTILLTVDDSYDANIDERGYKAATKILFACMESEDTDSVVESLMTEFMAIEGVQENVYESIIILDSAFDDVLTCNMDKIKELELSKNYKSLATANKLLSTSLFIDLNKAQTDTPVVADNDYIMKLRDSIVAEFASYFEGMSKPVMRSAMCKILAAMPIFLNSQQEIKEYFDYVLGNCRDDSELTGCEKLICDIIEED